jgi:hypothetical protein
MAEDKSIRDPGAAGQAGGRSDSTSPAAGKTSTHRPGHKPQPPPGVTRGPVPKPGEKQSEPEMNEAGTPPGPLAPGNRA